MLIDGDDEVYMLDRDNCVFKVSGLKFLHSKDRRRHLKNTLLDGVSSLFQLISFYFIMFRKAVFAKNEFLTIAFVLKRFSSVSFGQNCFFILAIAGIRAQPASIRK